MLTTWMTSKRSYDDELVVGKYYYLNDCLDEVLAHKGTAFKLANNMDIIYYKFKIKNCRCIYKLIKIEFNSLTLEY